MPILKAGDERVPEWCEMRRFELLALRRGEERALKKTTSKEELIVCRGSAVVRFSDVALTLPEGAKCDFDGPAVEAYTLAANGSDSVICRLQGTWASITSSGLFSVETAAPRVGDTPYAYRKTTAFDNHYHDCDEYWIVFEGEATVVSEGRHYDVGRGDCVATGMGLHHDVVAIRGDRPLRAVWFEGTLEGEKRCGHLWEPKHGRATPRPERV
jgi:mannose-6-phosphate isomerase-like protein (cupin superfamily)